MKKINPYILLLVIAVLFSCKKDHSKDPQPPTSGKKYTLNLSLSAFSQQIVGSDNKLKVNSVVSDTGTIRSMFKVIGVIISDSTGSAFTLPGGIYNAKTYNGSIKYSMLPGKYKIAVYAGQEGCGIVGQFLCYGYDVTDHLSTYNSWGDTFVKVFTVTVPSADVNINVQLERLVGEIELDVKDNLPANAYSFSISRTREDLNYSLVTSSLVAGGGVSYVYSIIPDSSKNKPNYKFTYITPFVNKVFPITFTCTDKNGNVLSQKVFNNNIVQKNQRVIYSGNFFGTPSSGNSFQPTISTTWDPNPINISF